MALRNMAERACRRINTAITAKEKMNDFGIGLLDYGARMYDGATGRWNGVDALSEKYAEWSGYNYVLGNPVKHIDTDGKEVKDNIFIDKNGDIIGVEKTTAQSHTVYRVEVDSKNSNDLNVTLIQDYSFASNGANQVPYTTLAYVADKKDKFDNGGASKEGPNVVGSGGWTAAEAQARGAILFRNNALEDFKNPNGRGTVTVPPPPASAPPPASGAALPPATRNVNAANAANATTDNVQYRVLPAGTLNTPPAGSQLRTSVVNSGANTAGAFAVPTPAAGSTTVPPPQQTSSNGAGGVPSTKITTTGNLPIPQQ